MKKADFVKKVSEKLGTTQKDTRMYVDCFLETILDCLIEDDEVDFYGHMKFTRQFKDATTARNVQTGEPVVVPAKYVPKCKFSTYAKEKVNTAK